MSDEIEIDIEKKRKRNILIYALVIIFLVLGIVYYIVQLKKERSLFLTQSSSSLGENIRRTQFRFA